jgi:thiamine kinase-like enzyme
MAVAEMVARFLAPSENGRGPTDEYQTLIHGDVKSDNLFSSATGESVVFYDFQYTGLGLGVCDLAKLFTCAVPLDMLVNTDKYHLPRALGMQDGEKKLLESYLKNLRTISGKGYDWDTFVIHWETVLVDWLRFQASWGFWGNTEWLEARVRWILDSKAWRNTLAGVHL